MMVIHCKRENNHLPKHSGKKRGMFAASICFTKLHNCNNIKKAQMTPADINMELTMLILPKPMQCPRGSKEQHRRTHLQWIGE